ncbi:MAG: peptidoglycan DD-metalloendopeptidase family protein [Clostridia bacterium]|nr:peptidoglycan DD-metalloendopeptidase family protein [Clostridia bacterium]
MLEKKLNTKIISFISIAALFFSQSTVAANAKARTSRHHGQADLNSQLAKVRNDISNRSNKSQVLMSQIKSFQNQIDTESKKLEGLNQSINEKQARIDELQEKITQQRETLANLVRDEYISGNGLTQIEALVNSDDFWDLLDSADIIQKLSNRELEDIKSYVSLLDELDKIKEDLAKDKDFSYSTKEHLSANKKELESTLKNNNSIIASLKNKETQIAFEKKKQEEATSKAHMDYISSHKSQYTKGRYRHPIPGYRITSPFGKRRRGFHYGVDFSGSGINGKPILAVADGVVIKSNSTDKWGHGWGYCVMVDHGNGYATQYAHLSAVSVKPGQHVKSGDVLGKVGNTGHSFGSHLHFETWHNGSRYNPATELQ